jgi:hypothetical protein
VSGSDVAENRSIVGDAHEGNLAMMRHTLAGLAILVVAFSAASAVPRSIDYGILGAPTSADTNEFGGLQPTPQSDLHIFRALDAQPPKALSDPTTSEADRVDTLAVYFGYQRALFYAAVASIPREVTKDDWTRIRDDELHLTALACGGQPRATARYGLTKTQCAAWAKANRAALIRWQQGMHR